MVAADDGGYEDLRNRSVTPNFHYPSSGGGEESNGTFECDKESEEQPQPYVSTNGLVATDPGSPGLGGVRGENQPSTSTVYSTRDNLHSNSEENLRFDSNETSDTDLTHHSSPPRGARHAWSSKRFESDLSTAPFSSETSDMDTSGNEKIHTDGGSMSDLTCSKGDQLDNLSPNTTAATHPDYIAAAAHSENISAVTHSVSSHHTASGGSSGDEVKRKKGSSKPPSKPPLKPPVSRKPPSILAGSELSKLSPPNAKKQLCVSVSNPMPASQKAKEKERSPQQSPEAGNAPKRSKSTIHPPPVVKPKPPLMVKPAKPVLRPKPAHLNNQDLPLKGRHSLMLQPSAESSPRKREVTGAASGNYYKFTNTRSETTLQTARVESGDRRPGHLKKVHSEPSFGGLKKAPRSPTPAARKLTKVHEEQEHEELGNSSHNHPMLSVPLTKPAVLTKVKRQGLEKSSPDATCRPAHSSEDVEFQKSRGTSTTSSTDSSKSLSSSEAASGHSQSPTVSPSPSPATRKKPLPHQKPSVLPKKPSLMHQSVSATAVLQTKEEGPKDPIPDPERRVDSQVMRPFSRGPVRPVLASMTTSKNLPEHSSAVVDQSGQNSEENPVIKQTNTPMKPSTNDQGPPLPPKKSNRRSTHIELVIPGEDLPPELPPRRPRVSSPRRPPPSPPTPRRAGGEKRSTIAQANNVRYRSNQLKSSEPKRHSMFSLNLSSSQINRISENYEVCEFEVEFAESRDDSSTVSQQAPQKPPRFKIEESNVRSTSKSPDVLLGRTLASPVDQSRGICESKKGSDSEQESTSPTGGMRARPSRGSSKKKAPPKPPKYTSPDETSTIPRASTPPGRSTPTSLLRQVSDLTLSSLTSLPPREDTPPPLPSQPIPKKKDRLGSVKKIPAVGLSSSDQQRAASPLQPPKIVETRTARAKSSDEPIYDVIKDVPRIDPYNVVSLTSEGSRDREASPKLPPRNITKAGSSDDEKGDTSLRLPHFGSHIKSNSISLMFRRATSDRFKHKVSTMDPEVAETLSKEVLQRTPSLDRLNDRMDRSTRSSMQLMSDSSSEDECEASVVSPVMNGRSRDSHMMYMRRH